MKLKLQIQVLSDMVLLEGVTIEVTRVSNRCDLVPRVFSVRILPRPHFFPLNEKSLEFKDIEAHLEPKKILKFPQCVDLVSALILLVICLLQ